MRIDGITFKQEGAIDKMSDNSRPAQVGADNPNRVVRQTIAHQTELADGSIITRTYNATRVDTKIKDGEYRLKMRGTLDGTEDR